MREDEFPGRESVEAVEDLGGEGWVDVEKGGGWWTVRDGGDAHGGERVGNVFEGQKVRVYLLAELERQAEEGCSRSGHCWR